MNSNLQTDPAALRTAWQTLRAQKHLRSRDAAASFGVSEAQLVACECDGDAVIRLEGDYRELMKRVPHLGRVMALTRNESCVHERMGVYQDVSVSGWMGLVLGPDIDLRVFFRQWKFGYAVREATKDGPRHSLQFYDASGTAVHKIYLKPESHVAAWQTLAADFTAQRQTPGETVEPQAPAPVELADTEIDQVGLRAAWAAMTDTHEFFGLLKKFKTTRTQALRLTETRFARRLQSSATRHLLETVAASKLPIMIFVGNPGNIQIHTGPVKNIKVMGPWLNVLDPDFNLHLREDHIHDVWVVRKPTADGIVTSVELFDQAGENIALLFGKRKPGLPESEAWRATVTNLNLTMGLKL